MDTLEGLSNLPDMLAEVCRSMLEDQAMVSALRGRIGDMQERCGRIEARARKKRELEHFPITRSHSRQQRNSFRIPLV